MVSQIYNIMMYYSYHYLQESSENKAEFTLHKGVSTVALRQLSLVSL